MRGGPTAARAVGFALAVCLAGGCAAKGEAAANDPPDAAMAVYAKRCRGCHGTDGRMGPAVPLNDPLFLAVASDDMLQRTIADGRPNGLMPAFSKNNGGPLGADGIKSLVHAMRARWGRPEPDPRVAQMRRYLSAADAGRSPIEGDPAAGRRKFRTACASCHGDRGQGKPKKAGPLHDPSFLALTSDAMLRRMVITGRPDLKMPSFRSGKHRPSSFEPLGPRDVADIVAFIDTWRAPAPQVQRQHEESSP